MGLLIDYKSILSNPEKRRKLKHMYWLVLWWEKEKQIPMLVIYEYDDEFLCPACNFEDDGYDITRLNICPKCGQRLKFESEGE